jgi:hypothetical protein
MPYIKLVDRPKFAAPINEVLGILKDQNDTLYIKGEYFGYFVNRLCKRFLADPDYTHNSFNSAFFNESKKKTLANSADSIAALINRADPIASAGELNYSVSAVLWGVLGSAEGFASASYGLRTYLRAMLERVRSTIETVNVGSQRDMTMAFRRHLVIRGVLGDVISETYRRDTVPYEELKLTENGDIWDGGKLVQPSGLVEV